MFACWVYDIWFERCIHLTKLIRESWRNKKEIKKKQKERVIISYSITLP
jgi:predicted transcriptional regulator